MVRTLLLLLCTPILFAQSQEVRKLLAEWESAWNRGDLVKVASYYEDSPETTFISRELTRGGVQAILERYRRTYSTGEARGTLTFSEIEMRTLAPDFVLALGKYSLKRTPAGGGDASGRFTLVVRKTPTGWKIIHDHSS